MRMTSRAVLGLLLLSLAGCGSDCPPREPCPSCEAAGGETPNEEATASASDPSVRDDGTVRLDGTPEISPTLHARLAQYLETRTATLMDLSADGTEVLLTTRFGNTAQAHEVGMPMGDRHQITFGEEPVRVASYLPSEGEDAPVIYSADVGGNENLQLYRLDRRTGRSTLLTDGTSRNAEFMVGRSGLVAYTSNRRNGRDLDIYLGENAGTAETSRFGELFLERSGDWHVLDIARDGSRLLLQEYVSINDARIFVVDRATRTVTRVSREGARTSSDRAAIFSSDGAHAYVTSDLEGEHVELYEVDLSDAAAAWRPLTRDIPWGVEELSLSPDGRTLAFTTNEDGISVLRFLDTRSRRSSVVSDLPHGVITDLRFATNAPIVGLSVTSARSTGDVWTVAVRGRTATRWTESELGGLDPEALVEPTLEHFPTFDGRWIPTFYFRPRAREGREGPFPTVVWIHGGPEAQSRPWFYPLAQFLATEAGIAVMLPNVRGSDGYGRTYLSLDDGRLREDSVRDIGALLDWIGTRSELDAHRVAVYGGSYGGYMVLASLTHYSSRLVAGIDIVGIANFVTFLEATADYRRALRRVEYGDESDPEMRTFLTEISPVTRVADIGVPLFVAHGANDPRVPVGEAEQIVAAVRSSGHEAWYMLARNEGHGFIRKENRDTFTELSAMFLARHLGVSLE
jgi:dipeptidyl aminopeptidase/acylaminoacyl peptidase